MANTQRNQVDEVLFTNILRPLMAPNKTPITTGIARPGVNISLLQVNYSTCRCSNTTDHEITGGG